MLSSVYMWKLARKPGAMLYIVYQYRLAQMQQGCGGVALWTGEIRITMTFWNTAYADSGLVAQNQN